MDKPLEIDPIAQEVLAELARHPAAAEIVLGGYFALQQYTSYRKTHDIDAWWKSRATTETRKAITIAMQAVADRHGYRLEVRTFGETFSYELLSEKQKIFSFQIALRSIELDPPLPSPWPPLLIETLHDNIGSKMNALVDRGAPRDFTDIKFAVDRGLLSASDCWTLWSRKNAGEDAAAARQKVLFHLAAIEKRRPLDTIADSAERAQAQQTRQWFRNAFLK